MQKFKEIVAQQAANTDEINIRPAYFSEEGAAVGAAALVMTSFINGNHPKFTELLFTMNESAKKAVY